MQGRPAGGLQSLLRCSPPSGTSLYHPLSPRYSCHPSSSPQCHGGMEGRDGHYCLNTYAANQVLSHLTAVNVTNPARAVDTTARNWITRKLMQYLRFLGASCRSRLRIYSAQDAKAEGGLDRARAAHPCRSPPCRCQRSIEAPRCPRGQRRCASPGW
jgi:hypothetical protein